MKSILTTCVAFGCYALIINALQGFSDIANTSVSSGLRRTSGNCKFSNSLHNFCFASLPFFPRHFFCYLHLCIWKLLDFHLSSQALLLTEKRQKRNSVFSASTISFFELIQFHFSNSFFFSLTKFISLYSNRLLLDLLLVLNRKCLINVPIQMSYKFKIYRLFIQKILKLCRIIFFRQVLNFEQLIYWIFTE